MASGSQLTPDALRNAVMAQRAARGLQLHLRTPDGDTVLYPKDHATRAVWLAAARRKGYQVVEEGVS